MIHDRNKVSFLIAAAASAALSLLFLLVYGGTNWLAAQRHHVGTLFFPWELKIPFVSAFILPYLSIDLFFVGAPFLCRDLDELRLWTKRLALPILIAGFCFAVFPLRCGFPPVAPAGLPGKMFGAFLSLDAPYNLVPSLHAALGLLLFVFYFKKTRGPLRALVVIWFGLMAFSPVLTHQHHLVDIATGLLLGALCLVLVRSVARSSAPPFSARLRPNGRAIIPNSTIPTPHEL